jgi:hypothetical protein
MGLHDRELSPLSSNDIGDKMHHSRIEMPNHYNKRMKRSVTDTIRDQHDGDLEIQMPMTLQKPAYIPGELNSLNDAKVTSLIHHFRSQTS